VYFQTLSVFSTPILPALFGAGYLAFLTVPATSAQEGINKHTNENKKIIVMMVSFNWALKTLLYPHRSQRGRGPLYIL